jgi:hypothetical protein
MIFFLFRLLLRVMQQHVLPLLPDVLPMLPRTEDVLQIPSYTTESLSRLPDTADVPLVPPHTAGVLPIPPDTADPETQWAFLEEGLDSIMTTTSPQADITYTKYMSLYTVATTYCISSRTHSTISSTVVASSRGECHTQSRVS